MPIALAGGASAFIGDELVLAGGTRWDLGRKSWLKCVNIYDPKENTWRRGPDLPYAVAYGGYAQTSDGGLEIFGGTDGQQLRRECWTLDAMKKAWTFTGTVPEDLLFTAAARVGDRTYLFGGCSDVSDLTRCTSAIFVRDRTHSWKRIGSLPAGATVMGACAVLGFDVFLFGGCSMHAASDPVNHRSSYRFDTKALEWHRIRDLPCALRGSGATGSGTRTVYLLGGYGSCEGQAHDKSGFRNLVFIYDTESDSYASATPLPLSVMTDFYVQKNVLYGAGGEDGRAHRSDRMLIGEIRK